MRRVHWRGVKYLCHSLYPRALSQDLGDSYSITPKPTLSGTFWNRPLFNSYLTTLECLLIFFSRHLFYMSNFQPSKLNGEEKKQQPHLPSLNESWEPFNANVKHSGATNVFRGKTGKQGNKGYPLKVGSEVGGTRLLWDETHLLEPKQKPAKCIWEENKMWTAEKDTENNKSGPGCFAFLLVEKGVRM